MKAYVVSMESGDDEERVDVHDDQGPRDAAEAYAARLGTIDAFVAVVRIPGIDVTYWTRWRVEPVTTYRARPA